MRAGAVFEIGAKTCSGPWLHFTFAAQQWIRADQTIQSITRARQLPSADMV